MMDVQRMRRIVDVTTAGVLPRVALEAAQRWRGHSLVYVRSSANHLFRCCLPDGQTGYLRLTPAAERSRAAIQAELAFVEHVAYAGVAVARPLPSVAGAFVEDVHDLGHGDDGDTTGLPRGTVDGQRYHAVTFAGLQGRQVELEELDAPQYRAWGRTLARLHQASQTFPPHRARATWQDELRGARASLPLGERATAQVLDAGAAWLKTVPSRPQEYGLLHGDCELDNLVWDGEQQPQVLDFDSAVYAPYLVDVALALYDVWSAEDAQRDDHVARFCAGYHELRPLPAGLLEAMPRLGTLLVAVKVARVLRAYTTTTAAEDPPWLVCMRARHQQWLDAQRAALVWE
jgi:amicoumacin kinase